MNKLIYKSYLSSFAEEFLLLAEDYSEKSLKFITKEEYFDWVKQWKEDYKMAVKQNRINNRTWARDGCTLQKNKDRHQKVLDSISPMADDEIKRLDELTQNFQKEYSLNQFLKGSIFTIWYLLIIRKASKLRAGRLMKARLAQVN